MTNQILFMIFEGMIISFFIGAIGSLIFNRDAEISHLWSSFCAIIGSTLGIIFSASLISSNLVINTKISVIQNLLEINIHLGSLAALFILIISGIGLVSTIYGISYMNHYKKEYNLGSFGFFFNLFLLSQILVVASNSAIFFLYVWEIMSLTSLFLVVFEHKESQTIKAGIIYFIMTHVGTLFITTAFFLLYRATGSFDFSVIQESASQIPEVIKNICFFLFFIGFGTKAGMIPFHIWLPRAHGSAPSQVSALMSGVMIKMGIYMMIRLFLGILGNPPIWWGITVLLTGAVSSILGVLYALAEHDIKKLLAYHSIENIGIILMGLGASLYFTSIGSTEFAHLALIAALFHTINHAIFKSLLFLTAGSVINTTGTKNIEKYGGLIKLMPYTALFFLIGAVAISGLPPFNGFASEWLTYKSLFAGVSDMSSIVKFAFISGVASLAFTGGLAAACFVKAFGTSFLARPRSDEATAAKESPTPMIIGMGTLAALCIILGIGSRYVISILSTIVTNFEINPSFNTVTPLIGGLNLPLVLFAICLVLGLIYWLIKTIFNTQKVVTDITWGCGFDYFTPRGEITATGFARSLILIFRGIFVPSRQMSVEYVDANTSNRYFTKSKKVMLSTLNVYETYLYRPINNTLTKFSERVKIIQSGNLNLYLFYILFTLIAVLAWARYF